MDFRGSFRSVMEKFRIPIEVSPLQKVKIDGKTILIKRDDLNYLKCSKQRSIPYWINEYIRANFRKFVIPSSGNSGIVGAFCALYSNEIEELLVLLADTISDIKLQKYISILNLPIDINELRIKGYYSSKLRIGLTQDPRLEAFKLSKKGYVNLRGSIDDKALIGFESLADEVLEQTNMPIHSVYVPSSSGSTALGIYNGFLRHNIKPAMHIVQTTRVFALVKNVTKIPIIEQTHPSESIVDFIGHRRLSIEKMITESNGQGWAISASEAETAKKFLLEKYDLDVSYDSAIAFAAWQKSKVDNALLVFTG